MSVVADNIQYLFPGLGVSLGIVFLCFYYHMKKKSATYDVNIPTQEGDAPSPINTVSSSEELQREAGRVYDRYPPRYSTVDHPPPYSLFDPNLTSFVPGGPPPAYEMYPITLPLAPLY